jgi:hypothetical protein
LLAQQACSLGARYSCQLVTAIGAASSKLDAGARDAAK